MNKLRWGLLSTARINRRLIPPLQQAATRSELVAVASRNSEAAATYAREWQIPRSFGSYEALLNDPDIDAVYIPLPNHLHREWVIKAAQAGKHILCEKPLALNVADVDEMQAAARENDVVLIEAFMYRMHPQLQTLLQLIRDGKIGQLRLVRAKFSFTLHDLDNIRMVPEYGGGSLWDVGCYPVSMCQAIAGSNPVSLFGRQTTNAAGVDVVFTGQLHYADGLLAQIDAGFAMPFRVGVEVVGSEGVLYVPNPWAPDIDGKGSGIIHIAPDDTQTTIPTPVQDPYLSEVAAMEHAILDGVSPVYDLAASRGNIATINALYRSANNGKLEYLSQSEQE